MRQELATAPASPPAADALGQVLGSRWAMWGQGSQSGGA